MVHKEKPPPLFNNCLTRIPELQIPGLKIGRILLFFEALEVRIAKRCKQL